MCVCVNDETGELFIRTNRRGARFLRRPKKKKRWFFFKPDQWQNMTGRARDRNAEEPASLHREVMAINAGRRHISTSKWLQEKKEKKKKERKKEGPGVYPRAADGRLERKLSPEVKRKEKNKVLADYLSTQQRSMCCRKVQP